ncbi:MAG: twin-arginine translocase subunit TatC [Tetrasphaera sp.]
MAAADAVMPKRKKVKRKDNPEGRMSLVDHLLEFRSRLVKSAIALLLGSVVGWIFYEWVYEQLTAPIRAVAEERGIQGVLVNLNYAGATAAFSQRVNLSIWVGIIVSSPVILYQAWAYILPALTKKEKRISLAFIGATIPLFLLGCAFGYWIMPRAWEILYGFTPEGAANLTEAALYFRTVTRFILIFGITWITPVFLVGLIAVGVIPGRALLRQWRPALVTIFIVSAIVTPTPDPVTMFFMAAPLILLYFIAAGIGLWIDRRRKAAEPDWIGVADDEASTL